MNFFFWCSTFCDHTSPPPHLHWTLLSKQYFFERIQVLLLELVDMRSMFVHKFCQFTTQSGHDWMVGRLFYQEEKKSVDHNWFVTTTTITTAGWTVKSANQPKKKLWGHWQGLYHWTCQECNVSQLMDFGPCRRLYDLHWSPTETWHFVKPFCLTFFCTFFCRIKGEHFYWQSIRRVNARKGERRKGTLLWLPMAILPLE